MSGTEPLDEETLADALTMVGLNVDVLAHAINAAQVLPGDVQLGRDLRPIARRIAREYASLIAHRATPTRDAQPAEERLRAAIEAVLDDGYDHPDGCACEGHERLRATLQETRPSSARERLGLNVEVVDAVFAELLTRGWCSLPDGHFATTLRDVFLEAYARLSSTSTATEERD